MWRRLVERSVGSAQHRPGRADSRERQQRPRRPAEAQKRPVDQPQERRHARANHAPQSMDPHCALALHLTGLGLRGCPQRRNARPGARGAHVGPLLLQDEGQAASNQRQRQPDCDGAVRREVPLGRVCGLLGALRVALSPGSSPNSTTPSTQASCFSP